MYYNILKKKITSKSANIAIIGLGYVGLPLLIQFYRKGFNCLGIDTDNKKIESFNKNKFDTSYFENVIKRKKRHSVKKLKKIQVIKIKNKFTTLMIRNLYISFF